MGGPNGAGKTTLVRTLDDVLSLPENTPMMNPDAVRRAIAEVASDLSRWLEWVPIYGSRALDYAGVVTVEAMVQLSIEAETDICVETVLSTGKYLRHVAQAQGKGFLAGLVFVALPDPQQHVERVGARVLAGGHDVPESKIRARWERAHDLLPLFARAVDHLIVFSNEALGIPKLVAEKQPEAELIIYDHEALPRVTDALTGV